MLTYSSIVKTQVLPFLMLVLHCSLNIVVSTQNKICSCNSCSLDISFWYGNMFKIHQTQISKTIFWSNKINVRQLPKKWFHVIKLCKVKSSFAPPNNFSKVIKNVIEFFFEQKIINAYEKNWIFQHNCLHHIT